VPGFNGRHFMKMNEKGRLLVVLDGFDEMKHAMTWA
jgi:predicted NACHT family NTPase